MGVSRPCILEVRDIGMLINVQGKKIKVINFLFKKTKNSGSLLYNIFFLFTGKFNPLASISDFPEIAIKRIKLWNEALSRTHKANEAVFETGLRHIAFCIDKRLSCTYDWMWVTCVAWIHWSVQFWSPVTLVVYSKINSCLFFVFAQNALVSLHKGLWYTCMYLYI